MDTVTQNWLSSHTLCHSAVGPSWALGGAWVLLRVSPDPIRTLFLKQFPRRQRPRPQGCQLAVPLTTLEATGHPLHSQPCCRAMSLVAVIPVPSSDPAGRDTLLLSLTSSPWWPTLLKACAITQISSHLAISTALLSFQSGEET